MFQTTKSVNKFLKQTGDNKSCSSRLYCSKVVN